MKLKFTPMLMHRIMSLIVLGLVATAWLMHSRTEEVLENALLDQVKQHAHVFMLGIEAQILELEEPLDPKSLQSVIDGALARSHLSEMGFAIYKMYFFDEQGRILAHSHPGPHEPKQMKSEYVALFERGQSYMGDKVEYVNSGFPKVDIIVPLHYKGGVAAALEVEINLNETVAYIKRLDDRYESEMILIVGGGGLFMMFFVWWVIQRWLVVPIRSVAQVTENISRGELGARVALLSRDELGRLSESVNRMADSIERLFTEQEEAHLQMLRSLTKALEAKDAYTAGHSARVSHYSVKLGRSIGLPEDQLKLLKQGALMHDLGKIGISESILNKPGALDDQEYEIMRRHPIMTATIMKPLQRFKEFTEIAAWHHERWDGGGYPDGLKGEDIPLLARIVSIADTWDAMTGDRVYRKGMSVEQAVGILEEERHSGQWDPELVGAFVGMISKEQHARHDVAHDMFERG